MNLRDKDFSPMIAKDINTWILFKGKAENTYCLGSLIRDKYIQLNEQNHKAVEIAVGYMDGNHTVSEIKTIMESNFHVKLNVIQLCEWLCKGDLIENAPEDTRIEKQEMDYLSTSIKKVGLEKLYSFFHFFGIAHLKETLLVTAVIIIAGILIGSKDLGMFLTLSNYTIGGSIAVGIISVLSLFVLSIGLHEFAHAIVGYGCGLKPKEIVFALYLGTPMFYVKMPGIYTVSPAKRIAIWSAGVYSNLFIAALCIIGMQFANGDLKNFLLICGSTNLSLVFANLSPLLPLDGYFILSTLLKRPNLRKGSFQQFKKWVFRKENSFSGLFVIYFLMSMCFYITIILYEVRWVSSVIMSGIQNHYTAYDYLYEFRIVFLILAVIIGKKIIELIASMISKRKMVGA